MLDKILSGEQTEGVVEQIHAYLTSLGENVRAGKVPLEQFIVVKVCLSSHYKHSYIDSYDSVLQRLGKNPQDYPDVNSLPHVQVAMRMKAKGQSAKAGDVIPYIFCLPADGKGASAGSAKAANAYSPDEVKRQGSTLQVGEWCACFVLIELRPTD